MKRAVLMAGVPGTGKTTAALQFIEAHDDWVPFEHGKILKGTASEGIHVIGLYGGDEVFQGTDRLSMAVQPVFEDWVKTKQPEFVFIEGDRLVGASTIDFLLEQDYEVHLIVLTCPTEILQQRYKDRGSNQPEQFLKAKATKVANISSRLDLMDTTHFLKSNEMTPKEIALFVIELMTS